MPEIQQPVGQASRFGGYSESIEEEGAGRGGSISIISSRLLQEFEHARVHNVMLAGAQVMAATWHELALEIRNQPPRAFQRGRRIGDDFVFADEQQSGVDQPKRLSVFRC
jgi:hypothetical protein